jgi:hypothetical protein
VIIRSDAPSKVATLPGRYAITLMSVARITYLSGPVDLQSIVASETLVLDKPAYWKLDHNDRITMSASSPPGRLRLHYDPRLARKAAFIPVFGELYECLS